MPTSDCALFHHAEKGILDSMRSVVRYRYRAYPTLPQRQHLARTFGCARVVFNDALAAREHARATGAPYPSTGQLSKDLITAAKNTGERSWLAEVSVVVLQQALAEADTAYRNFFDSLAGRRQGAKMGHPKFRSRRDNRQAVRFTNNARYKVHSIDRDTAVLTLPKTGDVRLAWSRDLPSDPTSVTIIKEADGRYYASFVVTVDDPPAAPADAVCGIDLGQKTFAVITTRTPDGAEHTTEIVNPRFLRRKARALARSQRNLSRKKKGSANRAKAVTKVAVHHRKVREARLDHAHHTARRIIDTHQVIAVENLAVSAMAKAGATGARGRGNRRSVHDTGLGQFLTILKSKADRAGRTLITVGRWYSSTRTCFNCQAKTGPKGQTELSIRNWTCRECGVQHNRDVNAARNILAEGLRLKHLAEQVAEGHSETQNGCGGKVRPGLVPAPLETQAHLEEPVTDTVPHQPHAA